MRFTLPVKRFIKMKHIYTAILLVLFAAEAFTQVVISPYVAFADQNNKTSTLLVTNETLEAQEIQVYFKFGYPISDMDGNVIMKYADSNEVNSHDITSMVRVFPKKFVLNPGEQQTVRLTVKVPANLPEGAYWTRIVTTSQAKNRSNEASSSFAKVNFVLSQVTTLVFRNKRYQNTIAIKDVKETLDSQNLNMLVSYDVSGDSPFFAENNIKIYDSNNKVVKEKKENFSIYGSLSRKSFIDVAGLKPGSYTAEINLVSNLKTDVPSSDNPLKNPIKKKVYFTVK